SSRRRHTRSDRDWSSDVCLPIFKQMLAQNTGGSIVNITSTMVDHPIAGINVAVAMITKGGLEAVTRSLAMEYAKQGIRVNAVAPDRKSTRLNSSHDQISYAVFCL